MCVCYGGAGMQRVATQISASLTVGALVVGALALAGCGDDDLRRSREPGDSWSIVVLPDTQVYALRYPQIFRSQLAWIAGSAQAMNLRFVAHVGDVTETDADSEWRLAQESFAAIEATVPYALVPGNHDYALGVPRRSHLSTWFSPAALRAKPTFGGLFEADRIDNSFQTFSVDGEDWLVLALEWGPRDAVLQWARDVLEAHPAHQAMVVTHAYLYSDDTRYDWAAKGARQSWNPHAYASGPRWPGADELNDGQQIWDKLITSSRNVRLVVSGHVADEGVGRLTSTTRAGTRVHQLLANFQGHELGGGGYLRILRFFEDEIEVRTYSPYLDAELFGSDHSFTLPR
jgi:3',5'-cyclic AMP phosphodiesterase CpdA